MAKFTITDGFGVMPVFGSTEDLAHMLRATIKPVGVSSAVTNWK